MCSEAALKAAELLSLRGVRPDGTKAAVVNLPRVDAPPRKSPRTPPCMPPSDFLMSLRRSATTGSPRDDVQLTGPLRTSTSTPPRTPTSTLTGYMMLLRQQSDPDAGGDRSRSSTPSTVDNRAQSLTTDQLVDLSTDAVTMATLLFSSTDSPSPTIFTVRQRKSFPDWYTDEMETTAVGIIAAWRVLPLVVRQFYMPVEQSEDGPFDDVWCLDNTFLDRAAAWSVNTMTDFADYPAGLAMAAIAQQLVYLMSREPQLHINETVRKYREHFLMFEHAVLQRLAFGAWAGVRLALGMLRRSVTGDPMEVVLHRSTWRRVMGKPYLV